MINFFCLLYPSFMLWVISACYSVHNHILHDCQILLVYYDLTSSSLTSSTYSSSSSYSSLLQIDRWFLMVLYCSHNSYYFSINRTIPLCNDGSGHNLNRHSFNDGSLRNYRQYCSSCCNQIQIASQLEVLFLFYFYFLTCNIRRSYSILLANCALIDIVACASTSLTIERFALQLSIVHDMFFPGWLFSLIWQRMFILVHALSYPGSSVTSYTVSHCRYHIWYELHRIRYDAAN